jgi:pseudomonalisin
VNRSISGARRALALVTLTALAACSGGGGSHAAIPASPGGSGAAASGKLTSVLVAPAKFTASATKLGPATSVSTLVMHVVVNLRDGRGLADYAAAVSNPNDGRYRQFLTAGEIGDRYGAAPSDYAAVAQYFAASGLRVGGWPQRLGLTVAGPRAAFEKAFGTTFALYRSAEGHQLVAPSGPIAFSRPLPVTSVADAILDPLVKHTNFVRGGSGGPQSGSLTGNTPQQMAAAFDFTGAYAAGYTGKNITIGIIGTGPIEPQDFSAYKSQFGWTGSAALTQVNVQPGPAANAGSSPTATPPPVTAPCTTSSNPDFPPSQSPTATCNPEDFEAQIDTEQAALAKDANLAFYLAYVPNECGDPSGTPCAPDPNTGLGYAYQGLAESDDEIQQAIADNNGSGGPDVVSLSYGGPEVLNAFYVSSDGGQTYDPNAFGVSEFAALAAEGVATFVSSGDQGAQTCAAYSLSRENQNCVSYPSGDVSVTSVGGVFVPLDNAGQLLGPLTAWGNQTANGASGGGVSTIVPKPAWQTGTGVAAGGRNQPDISLEGDPASAVAVVVNTPFATTHLSPSGGTSVAAPQMAAMWAVVLSACRATPSCATAGGAHPYRLGNAGPLLFKVYNDATAYPTTIYDVTFGNNGQAGCTYNGSCDPNAPQPTPQPGYSAGTGYDNVTGLGVPFARHLIKAVAGV